jgi:hypothetical protein
VTLAVGGALAGGAGGALAASGGGSNAQTSTPVATTTTPNTTPRAQNDANCPNMGSDSGSSSSGASMSYLSPAL